MFDFAWSELALIGVVAVVVLGPKELPNAMRSLGKFTRQARKLAGEFQGHVNDLMREAELEEVRSSVQKITNTNVGAEIDKLIDPTGAFSSELAETEREVREALAVNPIATPAETPAEAAAVAETPAVTPETAAIAPDAANPTPRSGEGTS
jgi:sec-independent protein translocase protein TatB